MPVDRLSQTQQQVSRLEGKLRRARADLAEQREKRQTYQQRVGPVIAEGQEVVTDSVSSLRGWRKDFQEAVNAFATDEVGELGRRLRDIQTPLYTALHRVVSTAHEAKRAELGIGSGPDAELERTQYCERAARQALVRAGGGDSRLDVWRGMQGEVASQFRHAILRYFADQKVRVYQPGRGLSQFRR